MSKKKTVRDLIEGLGVSLPTAQPAPPKPKAPKPPQKTNHSNRSDVDQFGLDTRQRKFVEQYIMDFNGSRAARDAGYSAKTAGSQATNLLKRPKIVAYLKHLIKMAGGDPEDKAVEVIKQLREIAFGDIRQVMRWNDAGVSVYDSKDLDDDVARTIEEVSQDKNGNIKIKMASKTKALELLTRIYQLAEDKPSDKPIAINFTLAKPPEEG